MILSFQGGSVLKNPPANAGDKEMRVQSSSGGPSGEENGNPLWYSYLENPMDGGAWWATVHGVTKTRTRLSGFTFTLFTCLFSSDGQGWMRQWNPVCWWFFVCLFVCLFCLLLRWGILHRVLLVVGWCWVLYLSGFLSVSSHYLILPRVSSLVV